MQCFKLNFRKKNSNTVPRLYFLALKANSCICFIVLASLLQLLQEPEPDHPLRGDLAEEYINSRNKFNKTAEEYTKKYSEKRPPDCR